MANLPASTAYYIDRLRFALDFEGPAGDVYYAQVRRDSVAVMLKTITPDTRPAPNHTRHVWARWDAYVYTDVPNQLFEEFSRCGAVFVKELGYIDEGLWGFEVQDADGYVIALFSLKP